MSETQPVEPKHITPILNLLRSHRFRFWFFVACLLAVIGWGAYAFYLESVYGLGLTGDRLPNAWGTNIVDFVFFIAISMAGTIVSGVLRASNTSWRRPITRIAEMITIAALPIGALFPMIDLGVGKNAINLFIYGRLQSPIEWDTIAICSYLVASLIYFYLPLIPDFAACRDYLGKVGRVRKWLYSTLSLGWRGTPDQEHRLKSSIKIVALLVVPIACCVHSVLAWVFAVLLKVEVHSTVFPIFFIAGAVYSGVATILVVLSAFRYFYHLEQYIEFKHILYLGWIFFASNLVMIYLTVTEYLTPAWGAEVLDTQYIQSITVGPWAPLFWFMIVGGFIIPALIMVFPRTRTIGFIVFGALLADAGMWIERYLFVVPSFAVPILPYPPGQFFPSWEDMSVTAMGVAGFILILVVLSKLVPVVSIWEISEGETPGPTESPAIELGGITAAVPQTTSQPPAAGSGALVPAEKDGKSSEVALH